MLRVVEEFHATHTGRQRKANEDSLYARSPLFAVADGMGGAQAGEIASRIAVETLGAAAPDHGSHPPEERLAGLVQEANGRIHELARSDDRRAGMGTTMTVVLVGADDVTIAHVGDSRAYLLRDGRLSRLTRDHSLVEELVEQGKLTPEEAATHPQRSVITRAVGPDARVQVDTQTERVQDGDVLLICSDGLTTMVDEPGVERLLLDAGSLEAAGRGLIDAANDAGGRDNISVVLLRLEDVGSAGPAPASEQETMVGRDLRTDDVRAALAERETRGGGPIATLERDMPAGGPSTRRLTPQPPPPPSGASGTQGASKHPRLRKAFVALTVGMLIAVPLLLGGLLALRSVYFVGSNDDGFVTVFRGLPYDVGLGVELYQSNYTSGVTIAQVPRGRRAAVTGQDLRSQEDAYDLVRQLELGQVLGTR